MFLHVCPSRPASVPQAGVRVHSPTSLSEITSPTSHGVLVLLGFGGVDASVVQVTEIGVAPMSDMLCCAGIAETKSSSRASFAR
jgi:hypothetical protein